VIAIASVSLFAGYLLLYAAVHDDGRFAFQPWAALLTSDQQPEATA